MLKKLVLIDKFPIILSGFEQLLSNNSVCEVLGCFTNMNLLINNSLPTIPDIIILGINQNSTAHDLYTFNQLKEYFPSTLMVVNDDFINYKTWNNFINLGAKGYFVKNLMEKQEVIHGIGEVLKGRIYVCKDVR